MKVICTQENLKAGLATTGRVITSTNTLPILNNLLLKTENGVLKISSTNLEIAITTSVRCKIEKEGAVTVMGKTLMDLVNNLPNKNITLKQQEGELFLETDNYHTKIKTLPAEDFPLIPKVEDGSTISLNSQELKSAIDQVFFAASTNQTQPEISGVLIFQDSEGLRLVATDRYRLAERKLPKSSESAGIEKIIPQKTIAELSRVIGSQKGNIDLLFSSTQAEFNFNETQIISRLVDGQYPDYKQIIPTGFNTTVTTERSPLISALKTTAVFSQANNSVKVDIDEAAQLLSLSAESSELGKSSVQLPSKITGQKISLILNYHYLLDALNNIDTKNVVIKIIDDNSPSLILPEEKNDYIYLIMPIKS